jgi:hypothetical protein
VEKNKYYFSVSTLFISTKGAGIHALGAEKREINRERESRRR